MAPLPPLPDNNTDCYFVQLSTAVDTFTQQIRALPGVSVTDFASYMTDMYAYADEFMPQTFVTGVSWRAAGSDITIPVSTTLLGYEFGTGTALKIDAPRFISFQGRSVAGYRTSLFFFGVTLTFPASYRIAAGVLPVINNMIALLGSESGLVAAKNGAEALWKSYVNCGFNSYKERRNRL